jgi:Xaa-Pro aminopeptidase
LLEKCNTIYLDFEPNEINDLITPTEKLAQDIKTKRPWVNVKNARPLFANASMIKHEEEIEEMKKAIHITRLGIENILVNMKESYEYQLESYFDQVIKFNGSTGYAFATIAASGKNATCLHYSDNDSIAHDGDLILFDLGSSVNMYCSDISRTFPVNGKFTERQKEIHNIVLEAQKKVFEAAKPVVTIRDLQQVVVKHYEKELQRIGLIKDPKEVSKYYYHGVSHHIGLDCHDLSDHFAPLKAGEVISNEPGFYIEEEGIGIRIEDDMMITEHGSLCLSQEILKNVEDIEAFMAKNKR